jgi:hypothetical protein
MIGVECPKCGYVEDLVSVANAPRIGGDYPCPECGTIGKSCYTHGECDCGEHVRLSHALAVHPDMIADGTAQKIHPGANFIETPGGMYALEIRSRHDKLKRMRERERYTGMTLHESDGKD